MTSTPFDMDNYMPNWEDDLDFGAFLNSSSDEGDQGVMSGLFTTPAVVQSAAPIGRPIRQDMPGTDKANTDMADTGIKAKPHVEPIITSTPTEKPSYACSCVSCLSVGALKDWPDHGMSCRFPDCSFVTQGHSDDILHERSHFHKAGSAAAFCCVELACPFTSKRWPDLVRHYTVKHCTNPKKYPCPVVWCKYSGDNGFARKDKLTSHHKNVHEGKSGPVKAGRVIKPAATLRPRVSGLLEANEC